MTVSLRLIRDSKFIGPRRWVAWLNDPDTSRYLESRGRWTGPRLHRWLIALSPRTRLYAICLEGTPVGTLKLEGLRPGGWANLALMIGEARARGCHIGQRAIGLGCRMVQHARGAGVWAGMRERNLASRRAFLAAGFAAQPPVPTAVAEAIRAWPRRPARMALWRTL